MKAEADRIELLEKALRAGPLSVNRRAERRRPTPAAGLRNVSASESDSTRSPRTDRSGGARRRKLLSASVAPSRPARIEAESAAKDCHRCCRARARRSVSPGPKLMPEPSRRRERERERQEAIERTKRGSHRQADREHHNKIIGKAKAALIGPCGRDLAKEDRAGDCRLKFPHVVQEPPYPGAAGPARTTPAHRPTLGHAVMDPSLPVGRSAMRGSPKDQAMPKIGLRNSGRRTSLMSACQKELPVVVKNQRNKHTNSSRRSGPLCRPCRKFMSMVSSDVPARATHGELQIKWQISHSAVVESVTLPVFRWTAPGEGGINKTGTQALGAPRLRSALPAFMLVQHLDRRPRRHRVPDEPLERINEAQLNRLRDRVWSRQNPMLPSSANWARFPGRCPTCSPRTLIAAIRLLEQKARMEAGSDHHPRHRYGNHRHGPFVRSDRNSDGATMRSRREK